MQQQQPYRGVWSYYTSQQMRSDGISPVDAFFLSSLENLVGVVHQITVAEERFNARDGASVKTELDALQRVASTTPCVLADGTFIEVVLLDIHAPAAAPDSPGPQWYAATALEHLGDRLFDVDMLVCGVPSAKGAVRLALLTPWGLVRMAILCNKRASGSDWCTDLLPLVTVSAARRSAMREQALVARPVTLETLAAFPLTYLDRTWLADAQVVCQSSFLRNLCALFGVQQPGVEAPAVENDNAAYRRRELVRHLLLDDDDYEDDALMGEAEVLGGAATMAILFPLDHAARRGFNMRIVRTVDDENFTTATICVSGTHTLLHSLLALSTSVSHVSEANETISPSACIGTSYQLALWLRFLWQSLYVLCDPDHHARPLTIVIEVDMDADAYPQLGMCVTSMLSGILCAFWEQDTAAGLFSVHNTPDVRWHL